MKSKSFDLKRSASEKMKVNKTFDFTVFYKTAEETKKAVETTKITTENSNKENKLAKGTNDTPSKRERTPSKKKNVELEPLDISHIDIDDPNAGRLTAKTSPLNESKATSTPQASSKGEPKVKSIMKNKSYISEEYLDDSSYSFPGKSKKRNKSVSFMLDDTEEVVVKKTKSNESINKKAASPRKVVAKVEIKVRKPKKGKKDITGKENKQSDNVNTETTPIGKSKKTEKSIIKDVVNENSNDVVTNNEEKVAKKGKIKKEKRQNPEETMDADGSESNNNEDQAENKNRKAKKKKHSPKTQQNTDSGSSNGEPVAKAPKKEAKPEAIVENLESLSIGDNANTLTLLLDEMTVVDKNKKKKNKQKVKQDKKTPSTSSSDSPDLEKIEEGKEKIKWKKRKWNKDKKGDVAEEDVASTSVIVENLPLSMVCDYKKPLADHFGKHGLIKRIGVAEVYPSEDSKPNFSTTIQFYSDGAATEALSEDGCVMSGSSLGVRRALPAAQTTLVLRSYGDLTDQSVSSALAAAGRIRSIRHLVKGRKTIATAFVEFDGPAALERALEIAATARIGGKRLHAAKYSPRATTAQRDSEETSTDA